MAKDAETKRPKNTKPIKVKKERKSNAGRKKSIGSEFDLAQVAIFGLHNSSIQEMADHFQVSRRTIERYFMPIGLDTDTGEEILTEFCRIYRKNRADYKLKIRRAQQKLGIDDRNPTMLIWLGKNDLGQSDEPKDGPEQVLERLVSFGMSESEIIEKVKAMQKKLGIK